jgi:hypothetical protein
VTSASRIYDGKQLSPSRRREAPCEGTNSPRLFTPGETKALAKSKVHQWARAWVTVSGSVGDHHWAILIYLEIVLSTKVCDQKHGGFYVTIDIFSWGLPLTRGSNVRGRQSSTPLILQWFMYWVYWLFILVDRPRVFWFSSFWK